MTVYRIKNQTTGLYSTGGENPHWTKKGKLWTLAGALKNHFNLVNPVHYMPGVNFVVVSYELVDYPIKQQHIPEFTGNK